MSAGTADNIYKKYLGIDYGTKRIGVAVSDDQGSMAFPEEVFKNEGNRDAAEYILHMCNRRFRGIETVIIGESRNYKGEDNAVMEDTREFAEHLKALGIETVFEPEVLSTMQAERLQGQRDDIDASAAAVILQSYLDRIKKQGVTQKTMDEINNSKYEQHD